MKIKAEVSQSAIAINDLIISDIQNRNLKVRLTITSEDNLSRTEIIIDPDQAEKLAWELQTALLEAEKCYEKF